MKRFFLTILVTLAFVQALSASNPARKVDGIINTFWKTSPTSLNEDRVCAMFRMQPYMDNVSAEEFERYLVSPEPVRREMEKGTALRFYQRSLEKLVKEIPATKVEKGSVAIWLLYNMGYVVKTPSHCFAIDLKHPEAERLVPYIDFLMVTHDHDDHYTDALNKAMIDAGKKVFTNFDKSGYALTNLRDVRETEEAGIRIRTEITDHNKKKTNFVITYLVDCGDDTGGVSFYFVGDSCNWRQLNPQGPVDIFVPHIRVGLDLHKAADKINPHWVLASHLLELGHPVGKYRWSYSCGLAAAYEVYRDNVYVPVWGDKIIYRR
ncbi:MAG: MBL fold metallo-hydrolase [Bacteroidales bacterium]|nr:MBL fold metallo-hydrolase [Bacteroidales bacterium]